MKAIRIFPASLLFMSFALTGAAQGATSYYCASERCCLDAERLCQADGQAQPRCGKGNTCGGLEIGPLRSGCSCNDQERQDEARSREGRHMTGSAH